MNEYKEEREEPKAKCLVHGDDHEIVGLGLAGDPCSFDDCDETLWAITHVCSNCKKGYTIWEYEARSRERYTNAGVMFLEVICQCGELIYDFMDD